MANHKSAAKRARQALLRTARNKSVKSKVKNSVRVFREALASGNLDQASQDLQVAARDLRLAGSKGVFHKRAISRRVGRLEGALHAAK